MEVQLSMCEGAISSADRIETRAPRRPRQDDARSLLRMTFVGWFSSRLTQVFTNYLVDERDGVGTLDECILNFEQAAPGQVAMHDAESTPLISKRSANARFSGLEHSGLGCELPEPCPRREESGPPAQVTPHSSL